MLLLRGCHFLRGFQDLEGRFGIGLSGHALLKGVRGLRDAGASPYLHPVGLFTIAAAAGIERRVVELGGLV